MSGYVGAHRTGTVHLTDDALYLFVQRVELRLTSRRDDESGLDPALRLAGDCIDGESAMQRAWNDGVDARLAMAVQR